MRPARCRHKLAHYVSNSSGFTAINVWSCSCDYEYFT